MAAVGVRRPIRVAVPVVAVVLAGLFAGPAARAQLPILTTTTTTTRPPTTTTTAAPTTTTTPVTSPPTTPPTTAAITTTTSAESGPTTTAAPPPAGASSPDRPPAADTTHAPAADLAQASAAAKSGPPPNAATVNGSLAVALPKVAPALAPGEVPASARQAIAAVLRSGPNSTRSLLDALAPLQRLGISQQHAAATGFGRFPVAGLATFTDDWLLPRFVPEFHLHQGTDIFAAMGTPVRSPVDGTLRLAQGGAGGLAAYVYQDDGGYFYMAHLSAFITGQRPGQRVTLGQVVGYVGDSGNAKGGSPHVHFEIHPAPSREVVTGKGKDRSVTFVTKPVPIGTVLPAIDPKATLDLWLTQASLDAPQVVAALQGQPPSPPAATTAVQPDGRAAALARPLVPTRRSELLWASSINPAGGALRLAEVEATSAAGAFDWQRAARHREQRLQEQAEAFARTAAILGPLTPSSLLPPGFSGD